ncbi:enoyl-CoA hydratase [Catalinimonas alkaloidigena]|uniref:enoyl-CoA hydratase/isomerase family protein n=1 Tax=Catalinimonas alkaloidigena TaxID=1075417 RepID=UPI0024065D01|nr:enoyl-CoA hydratase-related protein [Catalinimonas alkaloidigena]MDF9795139.1 enoyl-CoA hydratase [Catalinimonas alkaloidigena]
MTNFKFLTTTLNEGILTITISRADKMNALNKATLEELGEAFQEVYDEKDIKGIIVTGEGEKAFAAGADIAEIAELNELNGRKFSEIGQEVFALIEKCDKPVIAAVHGFALGGGCELAMACHLRVVSSNAVFGQPEVNLGLIPGFGGTQRLTQLVGKGRALEMMMTADTISAEKAKEYGLANFLVSDKKELMEFSLRLMKKILSKAPLAIGMVIDCVNAAFAGDENGYQTEANSFAACCKSSDFEEGTQAFLTKREAHFTGE